MSHHVVKNVVVHNVGCLCLCHYVCIKIQIFVFALFISGHVSSERGWWSTLQKGPISNQTTSSQRWTRRLNRPQIWQYDPIANLYIGCIRQWWPTYTHIRYIQLFSDHIQELWSDCIINKTFSHHAGNKNNFDFKKTDLEY